MSRGERCMGNLLLWRGDLGNLLLWRGEFEKAGTSRVLKMPALDTKGICYMEYTCLAAQLGRARARGTWLFKGAKHGEVWGEIATLVRFQIVRMFQQKARDMKRQNMTLCTRRLDVSVGASTWCHAKHPSTTSPTLLDNRPKGKIPEDTPAEVTPHDKPCLINSPAIKLTLLQFTSSNMRSAMPRAHGGGEGWQCREAQIGSLTSRTRLSFRTLRRFGSTPTRRSESKTDHGLADKKLTQEENLNRVNELIAVYRVG